MKDYYATLGVASNATQDDIKSAYRKLAFKFHPDRNANCPNAEANFKEVGEAYEVLCNEQKRFEYDSMNRGGTFAGSHGGSSRPSYGGFSAAYGYGNLDPHDLEQILRDLQGMADKFFSKGNSHDFSRFGDLLGGYSGAAAGREEVVTKIPNAPDNVNLIFTNPLDIIFETNSEDSLYFTGDITGYMQGKVRTTQGVFPGLTIPNYSGRVSLPVDKPLKVTVEATLCNVSGLLAHDASIVNLKGSTIVEVYGDAGVKIHASELPVQCDESLRQESVGSYKLVSPFYPSPSRWVNISTKSGFVSVGHYKKS